MHFYLSAETLIQLKQKNDPWLIKTFQAFFRLCPVFKEHDTELFLRGNPEQLKSVYEILKDWPIGIPFFRDSDTPDNDGIELDFNFEESIFCNPLSTPAGQQKIDDINWWFNKKILVEMTLIKAYAASAVASGPDQPIALVDVDGTLLHYEFKEGGIKENVNQVLLSGLKKYNGVYLFTNMSLEYKHILDVDHIGNHISREELIDYLKAQNVKVLGVITPQDFLYLALFKDTIKLKNKLGAFYEMWLAPLHRHALIAKKRPTNLAELEKNLIKRLQDQFQSIQDGLPQSLKDNYQEKLNNLEEIVNFTQEFSAFLKKAADKSHMYYLTCLRYSEIQDIIKAKSLQFVVYDDSMHELQCVSAIGKICDFPPVVIFPYLAEGKKTVGDLKPISRLRTEAEFPLSREGYYTKELLLCIATSYNDKPQNKSAITRLFSRSSSKLDFKNFLKPGTQDIDYQKLKKSIGKIAKRNEDQLTQYHLYLQWISNVVKKTENFDQIMPALDKSAGLYQSIQLIVGKKIDSSYTVTGALVKKGFQSLAYYMGALTNEEGRSTLHQVLLINLHVLQINVNKNNFHLPVSLREEVNQFIQNMREKFPLSDNLQTDFNPRPS